MYIALHGLPGAGKSTFTHFLCAQLTERGTPTLTLKLAEPLYQLQQLVYQYAAAPLPDLRVQDSALLADLSAHLRRINPDALTGHFAARLAQCRRASPGAAVICDDMRGADAATMAELGFVFVHVQAPAHLRAERRRVRGDLTDADDRHPSESQVAVGSAHVVVNDRGIRELEAAARKLAEELVS